VSAIIRSGASHAPDHGPSVVRTILQNDNLKRFWLDELDQMRARVSGVRKRIAATEQTLLGTDKLAYIANQAGMFSLLPLTDAQETALTRDHGIYVVKGARMNVARLGNDDIEKLIWAISKITSPR
ncbi:MAG: aminotransferase class I/II-fold pyridoxal phosphate-dependent enzyme, partial [Paracoccaceae bacterium]